jgi:two-component system, NtrC family, sensor kinase
VHVSVTDDGCGISPQTRARIFDPFFTTKTVGRGTGQGLAIVHNVIVERHHGTIEVVSTPGQGTTFTLHLPLPVADQDNATPIVIVAAVA